MCLLIGTGFKVSNVANWPFVYFLKSLKYFIMEPLPRDLRNTNKIVFLSCFF